MWNPGGYKFIFVQKHNENNEVVWYKARLVIQGFSQRPSINYVKIYTLVIEMITFRYLFSTQLTRGLDMHLMDVVIITYIEN